MLKSIHKPLEFDALMSLAYNCGGLSKFPNLLGRLNTGEYSECCKEFADITNGGDKGAKIRREREMDVFMNNIYNSKH